MEALMLFQDGASFMDKYLNWFATIMSIVSLAMGAYVLWRKAKPEIDKIRSETDSSAADAVESYANATKLYSEEVKSLKEEQRALRKELDANLLKIRELEMKLEDLTDYVDRLIHQIKSLNAVPVPFRARKRKSQIETNGDTQDGNSEQ